MRWDKYNKIIKLDDQIRLSKTPFYFMGKISATFERKCTCKKAVVLYQNDEINGRVWGPVTSVLGRERVSFVWTKVVLKSCYNFNMRKLKRFNGLQTTKNRKNEVRN